MTINVGQRCIECNKDTSFGSGRFVNRIPADNGVKVGYICAECLGCRVYIVCEDDPAQFWSNEFGWIELEDDEDLSERDELFFCWSDEIEEYSLPDGGSWLYEEG